ncbi:hypothetical protein TTHERM_00498100 (macronuclear) [Tetrahymena thermophila SB210]|uniref:Uncharacterized protein n=1 Tax=Tetrahymena thermophila (strain SB210) TaxID=312017 RepID=I7M4N9_TETTS|nr:hypothetical protein TTHERM_00498100 [Tetrahymena thermophila SB210]EAS07756.2 hypothetical protein TTHERM_00498100 [Tetrahymena thermophila SB210]|eukprot:XP_001027998.2 hypothetical protein TTHERM_00498100 [Tetrahymena thermophila SB210]
MEIEQLEEEKTQQNLSDSQIQSQKNDNTQVSIIKKRKRTKAFKFCKFYYQPQDIDDEPVYIFFLNKIYKNYEQEQYNQYRNYGFTDAGIAKIEYVQLDKIFQTIDLKFDFVSLGVDNFRKLIQIFRKKADRDYFELSNALKEYQLWINQIFKTAAELFSDKQIYNQSHQEEVDQAFPDFERIVKEWAKEQLPNELYEIELCSIKYDMVRPILKKKIYSKNLILFLGSDLEDIYQKLIDFNLKSYIHSLLNGGENNGKLQLQKAIKIIKWMTQYQKEELFFDDEITTLDGLSIPTQKSLAYYSYNYKSKTISQKRDQHFFYVTKYNFEPHWINYLIQMRQKLQQMPKQIGCNQVYQIQGQTLNQVDKNFEFICQQEYFLEKFNYIQKSLN